MLDVKISQELSNNDSAGIIIRISDAYNGFWHKL